jgi:hypothetical protein
VDLEGHQLEILARLVEAERRIPPGEERQVFLISHPMGPPGVLLIHPALPDDTPRIFQGDIETLAREGVVAYTRVAHLDGVYVTNAGFRLHDRRMATRGESHQRVQAVVRDYLEGRDFQARYPQAFERWREAEALLWNTDAKNAATQIGHLAREAMQEFVTALVDRLKPANVAPDKARTVARLRAVLSAVRIAMGDTTSAVLDALIVYWGAVSDLVQRQEHGAQKDGASLIWHDSRRVVFQVAMVMFELDAAVRSGSLD